MRGKMPFPEVSERTRLRFAFGKLKRIFPRLRLQGRGYAPTTLPGVWTPDGVWLDTHLACGSPACSSRAWAMVQNMAASWTDDAHKRLPCDVFVG